MELKELTDRTLELFAFTKGQKWSRIKHKYRGGFGHDKEYWDSPENLTLEAFADFFSAYARGNGEEINYLQQALPTANEVFLRTMKRVTK